MDSPVASVATSAAVAPLSLAALPPGLVDWRTRGALVYASGARLRRIDALARALGQVPRSGGGVRAVVLAHPHLRGGTVTLHASGRAHASARGGPAEFERLVAAAQALLHRHLVVPAAARGGDDGDAPTLRADGPLCVSAVLPARCAPADVVTLATDCGAVGLAARACDTSGTPGAPVARRTPPASEAAATPMPSAAEAAVTLASEAAATATPPAADVTLLLAIAGCDAPVEVTVCARTGAAHLRYSMPAAALATLAALHRRWAAPARAPPSPRTFGTAASGGHRTLFERQRDRQQSLHLRWLLDARKLRHVDGHAHAAHRLACGSESAPTPLGAHALALERVAPLLAMYATGEHAAAARRVALRALPLHESAPRDASVRRRAPKRALAPL